jgi:hypothetical protein
MTPGGGIPCASGGLDTGKPIRFLLSSPSNFQILETFIIEDDEPPSDEPPIDLDSLTPRIRGKVCREFITSSYSSSKGRSDDEVVVVIVDVGDKEGLWTIS